jgi:hypothetical protein
MSEREDRRGVALELYRLGRLELQRFEGRDVGATQYFIDELNEALLDLKQATIAEDFARMWRHGDEVRLLTFELRMRGAGDET